MTANGGRVCFGGHENVLKIRQGEFFKNFEKKKKKKKNPAEL